MAVPCIRLPPEDRGHLVVMPGMRSVIICGTDSHLSLQPSLLNCTVPALCHPAALPPPHPTAVASGQQLVTVSSAWFFNNSMLKREATGIQTELKTSGH